MRGKLLNLDTGRGAGGTAVGLRQIRLSATQAAAALAGGLAAALAQTETMLAGLQNEMSLMPTMLEQVAQAAESCVGSLLRLSGLHTENAAKAAAAGQNKLAAATTAAGKAARTTVAYFDQLNLLQATGGATGGGTGSGGDKTEKPEEDKTLSVWSKLLLELYEAVKPLKETLFKGLDWFCEKILKPLSQWAVNDALPAFFDALGQAVLLLSQGLEALAPVMAWLWDTLLGPVAAAAGEVFVSSLEFLAAGFERVGEAAEVGLGVVMQLFEQIRPHIENAFAALKTGLEMGKGLFTLWCDGLLVQLDGLMDAFTGLVTGDWSLMWAGMQQTLGNFTLMMEDSLAQLWESMKMGFEQAVQIIRDIFYPMAEWFMETVITPLRESFGGLWDGIVLAADICKQTLIGIIQPMVKWSQDHLMGPILNLAVNLATELIKLAGSLVGRLFDVLVQYVKDALTLAAVGLNTIIGLVNKLIAALNTIQVSIPDWVPKYGGKSFGINIPLIPEVEVPQLATGAVIPANREFLAVLGDQSNGRNLEAPEKLIRQIVREETANSDANAPINVSLLLDGDVIYRTVVERENRRGAQIGGAFANAY